MKDDRWDKMNNKFFYFALSKSRPIFDKVKYTDKFSMGADFFILKVFNK